MFGPIRTLCLAAALYLPLAFFVWFAFAKMLVYPVGPIAGTILHNWMPELFLSFARNGYGVDFQTSLFVNQATQALFTTQQLGTNIAWVEGNPMIYGYGLPVAAGLSLATPIPIATRIKQILAAFVLVLLLQSNGLVWETLQIVYFQWGVVGDQVMQAQGLSKTLVAFGYQFSYLMLPALAPVALWAVMNREFIERLIRADKIDLEELGENNASSVREDASP
jgi:hypothetical protein